MTDPLVDRRKARRRRAMEHGIVFARVRPGHEVAVVDVSSDGALVESRHRMLPGAVVDIHLQTHDRRASVRGRILRCGVSRLGSSTVCYRGAIEFDRHLPWFEDGAGSGYAVPTPEQRPGGPRRADATPDVV
jgi:hypothetical protein